MEKQISSLFTAVMHKIGNGRCAGCFREASIKVSHLKHTAAGKGEGRWCDEVLHREPGLRQPFPLKVKPILVTHVKQIMHYFQALLSIQYSCYHTESSEVIQKIRLNIVNFHRDVP